MEQRLTEGPGRGGQPPALNVPRVVLGLLGVMIAIHVVRWRLSPDADSWVLGAFAFIPARFGGTEAGFSLPGGIAGDAWTCVTYALLHADPTHLGMNAIWMAAFGSALAKRFGTARFLALSLLAAAGGAAAHLALRWGEFVPMIGASAAISGHMGAVIRFVFAGSSGIGGAFPGDDRHIFQPAPPLLDALRNRAVLIFLGVWFGLNLLFGADLVGFAGEGGSVAWEAHIGGFVVGLALFGLLDPVPRDGGPRQQQRKTRPDHLRLVADNEDRPGPTLH